jgi:hypothetical protein
LTNEHCNTTCQLHNVTCEKIEDRFSHMDTALTLRTQELERRLEQLNELRKEVTKDRDQFLKKDIYDAKTNFYDNWCSQVSERLTRIETRSVTWTAAVGLIFLIVTVVLQWVRK